MMTPVVIRWARRRRMSVSRFLIPLSYSSILGSITTVIGTSTTLTDAAAVKATEMEPIGFFELAPVGIPIAAVGLLFLLFAAPLAASWLASPQLFEGYLHSLTTMYERGGVFAPSALAFIQQMVRVDLRTIVMDPPFNSIDRILQAAHRTRHLFRRE